MVDDDQDLTMALRVLMENKKFLEDTAANIVEGTNKIELFKPHLIILDVNLESVNDGYRLCETLNNNDKYKDIEIVMLTSIEVQEAKKDKTKISDTILNDSIIKL